MNKRIGYGIVGVILILGIILCGYLYRVKTNVHVLEGDIIPVGDATVILEVVEQTEQDIRIEGYIEETEPVLTAELEVLLYDSITDTYYQIPTEFVEVATEEEWDTLNRRKTGFKGRLIWEKWPGSEGELQICILNRNNGKEEILVTDVVVSRENTGEES